MVKKKSLVGKIAGPSNPFVGYTFHAKKGGYRTFKTKEAARKAGYKV